MMMKSTAQKRIQLSVETKVTKKEKGSKMKKKERFGEEEDSESNCSDEEKEDEDDSKFDEPFSQTGFFILEILL